MEEGKTMKQKHKRPLPKGSVIKWNMYIATVIKDNNTNTIKVRQGEIECNWEWELDGLECEVVSVPKTEIDTDELAKTLYNTYRKLSANRKNILPTWREMSKLKSPDFYIWRLVARKAKSIL